MAGTIVVAESAEGAVASYSFELLAAARQLEAGDVTAFVAGDESLAQPLIEHGADNVIVGTSPALAACMAETYVPAIQAAIESTGASVVLISQTSLGRDLGPALAFSLKTAVAMDCVELSVDGGSLKATRSCYGGNARAEVSFEGDVQIATIKPKAFDALEADSGRSGSVTTSDAAGDERVRVTGTQAAETTGVRLEDAETVVSGGRGLGDEAQFAVLEELAALFNNAAVGASRAACDLGWYPPSQQVGLTGKTVTPDLYIAIGISGASQHMSGMSGAKNIVAINKDGDSNMVQVAKFAVVEDYKKVLPALIEEIKKLP
jgi:electron transfer flavoprotein alpha subunit